MSEVISESQALKNLCEEKGLGTIMAFKKDGGVLIYIHANEEDLGSTLITCALEITKYREEKCKRS